MDQIFIPPIFFFLLTDLAIKFIYIVIFGPRNSSFAPFLLPFVFSPENMIWLGCFLFWCYLATSDSEVGLPPQYLIPSIATFVFFCTLFCNFCFLSCNKFMRREIDPSTINALTLTLQCGICVQLPRCYEVHLQTYNSIQNIQFSILAGA